MSEICRAHIGRIDDLLDDRLTGPERSELHRHLAECDECRSEREAALSLRAMAGALPREIMPRRDLWAGIASRIEATERPGAADAEPLVIALAPRRAQRIWYQQRPPLAAAALLLIVLSSAVTAVIVRRGTEPAIGTALSPVEVDTRIPATLAAFAPAEREYRETLQSLDAEFEARRADLAPETVEVVERNLAIIDRAIAEARAALASDPASAELPIHLSDVYRRKVDLLQSAIQI